MRRCAATVVARGERGQALPLVLVFVAVLIGFAGFAIDLGRVWIAQQELQRAVDAAALVAGQDLPNTSTAYTAGVSYAGTGGKNAVGGWGITAAAPNITFQCVSHAPDYTSGSTPVCLTDSSGQSCHPTGSGAPTPTGVTTCNAVNVTETATVKTGLLSIFFPSFTVKATSTAAARGSGVPNPMDVFVILDTTGSMTSGCSASVSGVTDPSKLDCAKEGVRSLLGALDPCATNLSTCGTATNGNVATPADEVGILVFPALAMTMSGTSNSNFALSGPSSTALGYEINCGSNETFTDTYPPWTSYTGSTSASGHWGIPQTGPTAYNDPNGDNYLGYEAVGLSSDYRSSDNATSLNLSSKVVDAVDWGESGCTTFPGSDNYGVKDVGGQGSYLAGAITEAQELFPSTTARTGQNGQATTNAIVILSDGELNAPTSSKDGVAPSSSYNKGWTTSTQCEDAYSAATAAKASGTLIFTIGYDSSGNCDSTYTAAGLMQAMATKTADYYNETDSDNLSTVFAEVGTQLSGTSSLIPDCTLAPPNC